MIERDIYFRDPYRMMRDGFAPGLVRLDRAVPFIKEQLTEALHSVESQKTKTIGEREFILGRLSHQLGPVCAMSGDPFLAQHIGRGLQRFRVMSPRTARQEVVLALREMLSDLESYEPLKQLSSGDDLLDAQASEGGKRVGPADVAKEGSLFVIMPFSQDFNDVWKGAIQTASKTAGFHPIRVDTINRSSNITDDIIESIKKCRIAVVDVTGNNPNVMYELGYVMALEKPYVIVSQSVEFLPFDIKHIRTIVYANTWSGIEELRGKVVEFLKEFATHSKPSRQKRSAGGG
jgi:hypothetical protein